MLILQIYPPKSVPSHADVLDDKKGFLDYENVQLAESPYLLKLKFELCLFLFLRDLKIVFADVLGGKKGFLDFENVQFTESPH